MFEPPCTPVRQAELVVTLSQSVAMSLDLLPVSLKVDSSLPSRVSAAADAEESGVSAGSVSLWSSVGSDWLV